LFVHIVTRIAKNKVMSFYDTGMEEKCDKISLLEQENVVNSRPFT